MIRMTPRAAEKFKADLQTKSLPESTLLRVDVARGDQEREMRLMLVFDTDEPSDDDETRITEGARLAVNKSLAQALGNAQLDYLEKAGGFVLQRVKPLQ